MIDVGDEFWIGGHFVKRSKCEERGCYEEVIDKESRNDEGEITVYFDLDRIDTDTNEVIESFTSVSESSLERAIQEGNLVPKDGEREDYIRTRA